MAVRPTINPGKAPGVTHAMQPPAVVRELEAKHAVEEDWLNRIATRTEDALHHGRTSDTDFDIAAWFAMEEDEAEHARCMTECWYG